MIWLNMLIDKRSTKRRKEKIKMLVLAQNKKAMFDTAHARLFVQQSINNEENGGKPWVIVSFSEGRNRDPHPIIVSSHDTEEEAMSALAYIYAMAASKQAAVSMPNYTINLEEEAVAESFF